MVLAIDAGFRCLGWALIDDVKGEHCVIECGVIETKPNPDVSMAASDCLRATLQGEQLHTLLMRVDLEHGGLPLVAIELPHGGAKSARASRTMGIATGVIGAVCGATGADAFYVTPSQGKLAATRNRAASKQEVIDGVQRQVTGYAPSSYKKTHREAIADAIAAYLALTLL